MVRGGLLTLATPTTTKSAAQRPLHVPLNPEISFAHSPYFIRARCCQKGGKSLL